MAKKVENIGIYNALVSQLDKLARHNRQGSFRTKERYYEAVKRFCAYLADEYRLQKLENISGKHLTRYAHPTMSWLWNWSGAALAERIVPGAILSSTSCS